MYILHEEIRLNTSLNFSPLFACFAGDHLAASGERRPELVTRATGYAGGRLAPRLLETVPQFEPKKPGLPGLAALI